MDARIKWAVMAQLRRGNPSLPPKAKVGTHQRRLDTAIAIAQVAFSGDRNPRDWAAMVLLSPSYEKGDPMYKDLCQRLARAIWHEQPDELLADCWFHLYTKIDLSTDCGFAPKEWDDILPTNPTTNTIQLNGISEFRRELLKLAAEIDGSFALQDEGIVPTPCLTGRSVRLINRLASMKLPIPTYRGREYEDGQELYYYALLRYFLLHSRGDWAARTARYIGNHFITRSMTSGHIYGFGVQGQARPWDTRKEILRLELDPRITAGADQWLVSDVYNVLARAIA